MGVIPSFRVTADVGSSPLHWPYYIPTTLFTSSYHYCHTPIASSSYFAISNAYLRRCRHMFSRPLIAFFSATIPLSHCLLGLLNTSIITLASLSLSRHRLHHWSSAPAPLTSPITIHTNWISLPRFTILYIFATMLIPLARHYEAATCHVILFFVTILRLFILIVTRHYANNRCSIRYSPGCIFSHRSRYHLLAGLTLVINTSCHYCHCLIFITSIGIRLHWFRIADATLRLHANATPGLLTTSP